MDNRVFARLQVVAEKKSRVGAAEYGLIQRPRWKEYTLVKYKRKKEIFREKIWIDESKIFPLDKDFIGEAKMGKKVS